MSEMVERLARAFEAMLPAEPAPPDIDMEGVRDMFRSQARVAIAAMREPTTAMIVSAIDDCDETQTDRQIWQMMIDAALDE